MKSVMSDNNAFSRRSFLTGAAALGAVAAATGLAGCAPATTAETGGDAKAEDDGQAGLAVEHNPVETVECDVVVCGSGTGGMCAAVRAAELGGTVVMLEKKNAVGGTSNFAESMTGVGTKMQKELGVEIDVKEMFDAVFNYHHSAAVGPVLHSFIDNSGATVDWLVDNGCHFLTVMTFFGRFYTCHLSGDASTGTSMLNGEAIIQPMLAHAEELGVDIRLETPMTDLATEGDKVVGVYATNAEGKEILVKARGVILATGGYANNPELFEEFTLRSYDRLRVVGMDGRDGDGIIAARALGASLHHPETLNPSGECVIDSGSWNDNLNQIFSWQQNLRVNEEGERFWNEGNNQEFAAHVNALYTQNASYSIIDADLLNTLATETVFYSMPMYDVNIGSPLAGCMEAIDEGLSQGLIVKADTIEELAEKLGLDPAALEATVDRYNTMCENGEDEDYGKAADYLFPVKTAPFYAAATQPTIYATNGGIKVNKNLQVMAGTHTIEGLYAIGNDAGAIYGADYDVQLMPGSCQAWAATGGRMAAEHILG